MTRRTRRLRPPLCSHASLVPYCWSASCDATLASCLSVWRVPMRRWRSSKPPFDMAHALNEPRYEGQFLGYLGLLHARQGRQKDAQHCLDSGEALLRSVSDRFGLGVHLTSLAEARQLAGDAAAARASLAAATTIAAEVGAGPTSEIGLALTRVRALFESA